MFCVLINDVILGGGDQVFSDLGTFFKLIIIDDLGALTFSHSINDDLV